MADPSETTQVSREPAEPETEELLAAVRALAAQVGGLQAELQTLRTQARTLPAGDGERPGWDDGVAYRESAAWVRSLDTPTLRRAAVPWLLLEILFLVGVAILSAVAGLEAPEVIGVMAGAWLLVCVAEWMTARVATRQDAIIYRSFTPASAAPSQDPSWFAPPVERTALDIADASESTDTRLPPPASV